MRKIYLLIALLISLNSLAKTDTIEVSSKIKSATVFFTGAEISRSATVSISPGRHTLSFEKLPVELNPNSIQASAPDGLTILSVERVLDHPSTKKSPKEKELSKKIEDLEIRIRRLGNQLAVFKEEENLLARNSSLSNKNGTIAELKEASIFYRQRLSEIKSAKLDINLKIKDETETRMLLYKELGQLSKEKRTLYSKILVTVESMLLVKPEIQVTYFLESAGWVPSYDFRVQEINKPLKIVYNADVYQSTGEDWNDIQLTLSTDDPTKSTIKPELIKWYINRKDPYSYEQTQTSTGIGTIRGVIIDKETGESIPTANVILKQGNEIITGTTTDFDGYYNIKPVKTGYYTVEVSFIGYKKFSVNQVLIKKDEITMVNAELSQEKMETGVVELIVFEKPLINTEGSSRTYTSKDISSTNADGRGYGRNNVGINIRGGRNDVYIDGIKVRGQNSGVSSNEVIDVSYISSTLKTAITSYEYVIEEKYTILSNGTDYHIKIKEKEVDVNYVFYAVPRLTSDVFLSAELTDFYKLNLVSGKAFLFYEGTFRGESFLDMNTTTDTLELSLGRDKSLTVERNHSVESLKKSTFGTKQKQQLAWDISIRNNKNIPVKVIVQDQYPLSTSSSVEIELVNSKGAVVDPKTGFLNWDLSLLPGASDQVNFSYNIAYPKYLAYLFQ